MEAKLHKYQEDARNWILAHSSTGLFLPPGLGKTLISLSAVEIILKHTNIDRVLVIAPLRVAHLVWPNEIKKWDFDFSIGILHGKDKDTIIRQKHDIYVINPEGLKWLFNNHTRLFEKYNFMLICDESTLFKNYSSQRFKLLKSHLKLFTRRVILTGTPAPNGLLQLWSQIYILDFGKRLGTGITKYRNKWFTKDYSGFGYNMMEGADTDIYRSIDDIVMHKSNDELNLPEILYNTINVELPAHAMKAYKEMRETFIVELKDEQEISAVNAAAKASKLKQIANGTIYDDDRIAIEIHEEKLNATEELVSSLAGRPLLIVYEFLHDLKRLKELFKAPHIGSGVAGDELREIINQWNNGEIPVLLIQPQAGGHGLNLQDGGCHDVLHYSITFDLELYTQVNARVHRQGVKNSVTIHHLVADGTVDQKVMGVLEGKANLQNELLEYLIK